MNTQELNELLSCLTSNWPALKKVCKTWGNQHMLTIAMEENAELIQAISKIKRYGVDPINASHLNEEVADVLICIYELYVMGYLVTDKITEIIERKVERSMQRTQDYIKELEDKFISCKKANRDFFILAAAYVATLVLMIYLFIR